MQIDPEEDDTSKEYKEREAAYLEAIRETMESNPDSIQKWLTIWCPECERVISDKHHIKVNGFIAVGCEGYWVINPMAVGMKGERYQNWCDWTESLTSNKRWKAAKLGWARRHARENSCTCCADEFKNAKLEDLQEYIQIPQRQVRKIRTKIFREIKKELGEDFYTYGTEWEVYEHIRMIMATLVERKKSE